MSRTPQETNTDRPLVSAVIPTCDRRDVLQRCLEALVNQTSSNYEVIVVDDCSTDATAGIAAEFPVSCLTGPGRGPADERYNRFQTLTNRSLAITPRYHQTDGVRIHGVASVSMGIALANLALRSDVGL